MSAGVFGSTHGVMGMISCMSTNIILNIAYCFVSGWLRMLLFCINCSVIFQDGLISCCVKGKSSSLNISVCSFFH